MSALKKTPLSLALLSTTLMLAACGRGLETGMAPTHLTAGNPGVLQAKNGLATMPNEMIVATKGQQAVSLPGASELDSFTLHGTTFHLLGGTSRQGIQQAVGTARTMAAVAHADPNPAVYALDLDGGEPDDEFYPMQFGLQQQHVPQFWAQSKGDPNMVVAVIDTGVDYNHPDLAGRVIQGKDFTFRPGRIFHRTDKDGPMDDNGHGTHCAGIIGATANNGIGVAGVAPDVKLMAVKVLDAKGAGTAYDAMKGVAYAITQGAKIVSISLGGTATTSVERQFYEAAVQSGALIVAASGNSGEGLGFPAAYPGVLSVAATDSAGELARFSNHDDMLSLTAPGVGILSTMPNNQYAKLSGTSAAASFVSGAAALVWSAHPDWTAQQVKDRLEQTATDRGAPGVDTLYGHGELNLEAALAP